MSWYQRHLISVWAVVLIVIVSAGFGWQEHEIRQTACRVQQQRWDLASLIITTLTAKPGTEGVAARPRTTNRDILRAQRAADARSDSNRTLFFTKLGPRQSC